MTPLAIYPSDEYKYTHGLIYSIDKMISYMIAKELVNPLLELITNS